MVGGRPFRRRQAQRQIILALRLPGQMQLRADNTGKLGAKHRLGRTQPPGARGALKQQRNVLAAVCANCGPNAIASSAAVSTSSRPASTIGGRSIRAWWQHLGKARYPDAKTLTITADSGGANGGRRRLWKVELQKLADELALAIRVCHFPPGTSKWNKIEQRLFSFVRASTGAARPLESLEVIIDLIASTTTSTG